MRKLIILLIFIAIPLFILANASFFGYHQLAANKNPQLLNDRAYRVVQRTIQNWSYANLAWTNANNFNYYYQTNTTANPDSVVFYSWHQETSSFQRIAAYYFTYDNTGEYATHLTMSNTYNNVVYTYMDATFTYSPQGYLIGYQFSQPGNTGALEPKGRMTIQYTSTSDFEVWNWSAENEDMVPQWNHQTFLWDAQGRITQETTQISLDSLNWVNEEQLTHEYLPGDTTTGDIFVSNFSHQLPLMMISDFNGPFYGKQSQSLTKSWNNNQWVNKYKQVYTYNGNSILTNDLESKWQGGNWVNNGKNDYTYDTHNNLTETVYAIWSSNAWINDTKTVLDWSTFTANSDEIITTQALRLSAYPNPSRQSDAITFDTKLSSSEKGALTIYNLKGQKVIAFDVNANDSKLTWNGRDDRNGLCAAGIYFYRLSTNKQQETKKLVILK